MHSVPASCDLPNHCPTCSLGGTRTPCRRRQRTPRLPVDQKTVVQRRRGCRSAHRLFRSCRSLVIVHVIIASTVKRSARSGCAESHACTTRVCGGSRRAQLNASRSWRIMSPATLRQAAQLDGHTLRLGQSTSHSPPRMEPRRQVSDRSLPAAPPTDWLAQRAGTRGGPRNHNAENDAASTG
jgi:hypothetical protein